MARRSPKHRRGHYRGGDTPPSRFYPSAPLYAPPMRLRTYSRLSATRAPALDHSVWRPRTVRSPPLIRTVRSDTTPRFNPNRRRSADLPNRALRYAPVRNPEWRYPVIQDEEPPSHKALHCARRNIRREVLLALKQGNGAGSRGKPKSKEKCS